MYRKILVANDGSPGALRALTAAIALAKRDGAALHMVTVEELPHFPASIDEVEEGKAEANHRLLPVIEAARAQGLANARFEVGDATIFRFEAQSFDLVFSRFGVMFFGDPVAAFTNMRHALKPGGRLVFICWRTPAENPWAGVPMRAAQPFLPPMERPGPEEPGQYSFGDRARVERILTQAGFTGLSIEPVDQMLNQGRDIPAVMKNIGLPWVVASRCWAVAPGQIATCRSISSRLAAAVASSQGCVQRFCSASR